MKKILLLISFFGFSVFVNAQTIDLFFEQTDEFLKKHVSEDGKLDYAALKKSPGELLYILSNATKLNTKFEDKNLAKAFWVNMYNLQLIKGVVDAYPIKSVIDVPGFFKENSFMVGSLELTLDDIENTILREIFLDPCIHFVLSSAANGGSPMLNGAYRPEKLNDQMKERAKRFINDKKVIRVDTKTKIIEVPKIFEWYKNDFVTYYQNEVDFFNIFLEKKLDNTLKVKAYDFDWSLNSKI